jgi:hypothetical protein
LIDGASNATVRAQVRLTGVLSGASRLQVRGKPGLESVRAVGASSIEHEATP